MALPANPSSNSSANFSAAGSLCHNGASRSATVSTASAPQALPCGPVRNSSLKPRSVIGSANASNSIYGTAATSATAEAANDTTEENEPKISGALACSISRLASAAAWPESVASPRASATG